MLTSSSPRPCKALTQEQKAQNRCHSKKSRAEMNARSERNINSDLSSKVVPIKEYHLAQRGDRNVPLQYLKGAVLRSDFTYYAATSDCVTFSFRPTTRRYIGLPSFPSCYDSFFSPYYTQIRRTAFFPFSPILS